jgi:hypothetical protein
MRMFANRLSDPAMHTVLDEGDNVEQHLGLTLSLKGYVGSEYRDQVEKEGGQFPLQASEQDVWDFVGPSFGSARAWY